MPAQQVHPELGQLSDFALGRLDANQLDAVESHLASCDTCCDMLRQMKEDTFVGLVREAKARELAAEQPVTQADGASSAADQSALSIGSGVTQASGSTPPVSNPDAATIAPEAGSGATESPALADVPAELRHHPRYRIVEVLGVGGMGSVYKAEHRLMQRMVALKVINPKFMQSRQAVERFRREARAAAKLQHPNIVHAYDAEQAGDSHFLVMEYVPGVDLGKVLEQRGPLPVAEACEYIRQAALGLQHAHESGMVHRDIKPQNLMVVKSREVSGGVVSGGVKILDFGLASLTAEAVSDDGATQESAFDNQRSSLTQAGSLMGTPDYMAPEQAKDARSADIRADIYSLGCTLYTLLTGKVPFPGGTAIDKVIAHASNQAQPIRNLCPEAPAALVQVLDKMMAKAPADRYQTPADVAEALDRLATLESETGSKRRSRRPRSLVAAALAMVFAGLALLAGVVFYIVTDNGTIEIRTDDENIKVIAERNGKMITLEDFKNKQTWVLDTGEWTVRLDGNPEGLKIELPQTFTLKRRDKHVVTVKRIAGPNAGKTQAERDAMIDAAAKAAAAWLKLVDERKLAEAWEQSGRIGKESLGKDASIRAYELSMKQFGKLKARALYHGEYSADPPGAPPGKFVKIQYASSFENLKEANETVVMIWEADGQWRPITYAVLIWTLPMEEWRAAVARGASRAMKEPDLAIAPFDPFQAKAHQQAWANHLGVEIETANSLGMKMRLIPPGEFQMGTGPEEEKRLRTDMPKVPELKAWLEAPDKETPQHRVKLTKPFRIAAHEVTVAQFRKFVEATKHKTDAEKDGKGGQIIDAAKSEFQYDPATNWQNPGQFKTQDDFPVTQVSWNDADAFCKWLSKKEGVEYRLPTEAEWEFACRAGSQSRYSFGDSEDELQQCVVVRRHSPLRVGSLKANAFGLHDMEGNAWEWCADYFKAPYYGWTQVDPAGSEITAMRTYRGGAFNAMPLLCRPAMRWGDAPDARTLDTGFRVVMVGDLKRGVQLNDMLSITNFDKTRSEFVRLQPVEPAGKASEDYILKPDETFVRKLDAGKYEIWTAADGKVWKLAKTITVPSESKPMFVIARGELTDWDDTGFRPLFNRKDLTGWKTHPKQPNGWKVDKDGILVGSGPYVSHLFTERDDFDDFHLRTEVKINAQGNSGIYLRAPFDVPHLGRFPKGYEAQILNGVQFNAGQVVEEYLTGSLYGLAPFDKRLVLADTWFTLEIIAKGQRITIKVNGQTTVDYTDAKRTYQKGHIALQLLSHTAPVPQPTVVHFKKIEIKELVDEPAWSRLFNEKDLTGWVEVYDKQKHRSAPWDIVGNVLALKGDENNKGYLRTEKQYREFHLRFEYKPTSFAPQDFVNNSVLMWGMQGADDLAKSSPLRGTAQGPVGIRYELSRKKDGTPYGVAYWPKQIDPGIIYPGFPGGATPADGWNRGEIIAKEGLLELRINGVSKIAKGYKPVQGHIGLLSDMQGLHFRNIEVQELSTTPARDDRDLLQGVWKVMSMEEGGDRIDAEKLKETVTKMTYTFEGKRAKFKVFWDPRVPDKAKEELQDGEGKLDFDATTNPKTIEIVTAKKGGHGYVRGIYRLSGDELQICYYKDDGLDYPTAFATKRGGRERLMILRRETDQKTPPGETGWQQLFNGKDFTGWGKIGGTPATWSVDNGIVRVAGSTGQLVSDRNFQNFQLRAEVRISPGASWALQFRTDPASLGQKDAGKRGLAAELVYKGQTNDVEGHMRMAVHPTLDGKALANLIVNLKPNDWFPIELTAQGDRVDLVVSGGSVGASKFGGPPGPGRIVVHLLDANSVLEVRKLEIKELPAPAPTGGGSASRFKNNLDMEFALIPKGKAWLGGGKNKAPDQEIEFKEDFYLGVYEVTQEEWQKVMGRNPSHHARSGGGHDRVNFLEESDIKRLPVEEVSWLDCQEFVKRLNERLKEPGWAYRLPIEAEWEYACRGGPMTDKQEGAFDYYVGAPSNTLDLNAANFDRTEKQRPTKVGSYAPNRLGLYDMHGNVEEWCNDAAPPYQGVPQAVHRGGYFNTTPEACAAAARQPASTGSRSNSRGLRVARVRAPQASSIAAKPRLLHDIDNGGQIRALAFSSDGKLLFAAGDKEVKVIDVRDGKELEPQFKVPSPVLAPLSVAGDYVAMAIQGRVLVVDLVKRKQIHEIKIDSASGLAFSAAVSPDGKTVVYAGDDGIRFHDTVTEKSERGPDLGKAFFSGLSFTPDGRFLFGFGPTEELIVVDAQTRKPVGPGPKVGKAGLTDLSRDGKRLAAVCARQGKPSFTILEVHAGSLKEVYVETNLPTGGNSPSLSSDGAYLALSLLNGTVQIWDLAQRTNILEPWVPHRSAAFVHTPVALAPDGKSLATGAGNNVRIWSLLPITEAELPGSPRGSYSIKTLGDGATWVLTLDGTSKFKLNRNGQLGVEGTYKISKDQIELTDESGPFQETGNARTGTYQWRIAGSKLIFTRVADEAQGRSTVLMSGAWDAK